MGHPPAALRVSHSPAPERGRGLWPGEARCSAALAEDRAWADASACPALLIAAPASGQGKTTVTAALARLHTRQGRRVRVFKCGPDFLDRHTLASGQPVHNLDLWLNGQADVRARLHEAATNCDLILIEGVMGRFEGEPGAADLAATLGVPVLTVIDAGSMAGTFGALVHGLRHYRPGLPWAGVLANRVASEGHAVPSMGAPTRSAAPGRPKQARAPLGGSEGRAVPSVGALT